MAKSRKSNAVVPCCINQTVKGLLLNPGTVIPVGRNFLLMQDGSFVLMQDGSKILLQ